jgi:hypothetical protein
MPSALFQHSLASKRVKLNTMKPCSSLLVLTALISVAGCKPSENQGTVTQTSLSKGGSDLPQGWQRATARGGKISIGVPPGWVPVDLNPGQFEKTFEKGAKDIGNAELMAMKPMVEQMAKNDAIKLMAFHAKDQEAKFSPNVNIIEIPSEGKTLAQVGDLNEAQMKTLSKGTMSRTSVKVGAEDGVLLSWQLPNKNVGKGMLDMSTYLVVKGPSLYILTFSIPDTSAAALKNDTDAMVKTFKD